MARLLGAGWSELGDDRGSFQARMATPDGPLLLTVWPSEGLWRAVVEYEKRLETYPAQPSLSPFATVPLAMAWAERKAEQIVQSYPGGVS